MRLSPGLPQTPTIFILIASITLSGLASVADAFNETCVTPCSEHATCVMTRAGRYFCVCLHPYQGDGEHCTVGSGISERGKLITIGIASGVALIILGVVCCFYYNYHHKQEPQPQPQPRPPSKKNSTSSGESNGIPLSSLGEGGLFFGGDMFQKVRGMFASNSQWSTGRVATRGINSPWLKRKTMPSKQLSATFSEKLGNLGPDTSAPKPGSFRDHPVAANSVKDAAVKQTVKASGDSPRIRAHSLHVAMKNKFKSSPFSQSREKKRQQSGYSGYTLETYPVFDDGDEPSPANMPTIARGIFPGEGFSVCPSPRSRSPCVSVSGDGDHHQVPWSLDNHWGSANKERHSSHTPPATQKHPISRTTTSTTQLEGYGVGDIGEEEEEEGEAPQERQPHSYCDKAKVQRTMSQTTYITSGEARTSQAASCISPLASTAECEIPETADEHKSSLQDVAQSLITEVALEGRNHLHCHKLGSESSDSSSSPGHTDSQNAAFFSDSAASVCANDGDPDCEGIVGQVACLKRTTTKHSSGVGSMSSEDGDDTQEAAQTQKNEPTSTVTRPSRVVLDETFSKFVASGSFEAELKRLRIDSSQDAGYQPTCISPTESIDSVKSMHKSFRGHNELAAKEASSGVEAHSAAQDSKADMLGNSGKQRAPRRKHASKQRSQRTK